MKSSIVRSGLGLLPLLWLTGCNTVVLNPSGDIAAQQAHLVIVSFLLMCLIVVPVIALTLWFAWRYRQSNTSAKYDPDWDHSTKLELVIWGVPLLLIIVLGLITWISTHLLDPYRPLQRLDENRPLPADVRPLEVQVVALDWKWLFIYPEQGIATVNELATPIDRPVKFRMTASSVMNAFYIPAMAGMIYTMPAMETQLNAVMNKPGTYDGFSSNYSGAGFTHMRFKYHAMNHADFDAYVAKVKAEGGSLERADYMQLAKPSEKDPVRRWATVDKTLYDAILNLCVEPGTPCMAQQMHDDANRNARHKAHQEARRRGASEVAKLAQADAEICTTPADKTQLSMKSNNASVSN
ncbi:ubiquinol oxidase subunit II [Pseudoduganella sp. SL102]|uniref:ubiquinol oxidase subunit II n=1 Tax=Pseudoduganella sp. SL102 TaxID=2995154 RepID=UPI00248C07AC|nr:ubiquinol oxidase subunit II [Pseudoduganella sp. SL102]WBS00348.1 ubiquinol oxidase subunit II [Pseudoduganella sp. SL102]